MRYSVYPPIPKPERLERETKALAAIMARELQTSKDETARGKPQSGEPRKIVFTRVVKK